jgi:AraC family transcriptional regulator
VLQSRIERGKARLRERSATVSQIATELGFADQSHFTRTFRRLVGTSPRRFADLRETDAGDGAALRVRSGTPARGSRARAGAPVFEPLPDGVTG